MKKTYCENANSPESRYEVRVILSVQVFMLIIQSIGCAGLDFALSPNCK